MAAAARDLSNYQWRLVSNAIGQCSLPIFVKLVFAEVRANLKVPISYLHYQNSSLVADMKFLP